MSTDFISIPEMGKFVFLTHESDVWGSNWLFNEYTLPQNRTVVTDIAGASLQKARSFGFVVINTSNENKEVTLFDANNHLQAINFGLQEEITIACDKVNMTYKDILEESQINPFIFNIARFQLTAGKDDNFLTSFFEIRDQNSEGIRYSNRTNLSYYFTAFQFQANLVDVPNRLVISGSTAMIIRVKANTTVYLSFF